MLADSLSHGTGARDDLATVVQKGIVDALVAEDSSREVKDSDSGGTVFLMEQSPKYFFHKIRSYKKSNELLDHLQYLYYTIFHVYSQREERVM